MNCATTSQEDKDFNSKLVRLEGVAPLRVGETIAFQFQTGAIRSENEAFQCLMYIPFQFQTGAIRSDLDFSNNTRVASVSIPNWFD